ncbi:MAG: hypothetical protein AABW81_03540 [Nanoarchaeota archaeon]
MKKEDVLLISKLIENTEKELDNLELAYNNKEYNLFNKSKKNIQELQNKMLEIIK